MDLLTEPSQTSLPPLENPSPEVNLTLGPVSPSIVSLANFSSTDFGNTPAFLNSPRSVEICKKNGVEVDDLVPKSYAFYLEKVKADRMEVVATKREDIAKLRFERGEISRRKLIRTLGGDRDRMIMVNNLGKKKKKKVKVAGMADVEEEGGKTKSAEEVLMEREAKYLEKVQRKTEKELKQMLVYEMKRAAKQQEQRDREENQLRKDQERRDAKEQNRRDKMEKSFKISEDIQRRKEEDEEKLRIQMAKQFDNSIRQQKQIEEQKAKERKEAIEKAKERARLTEARKKATEGIFKKQREDVLRRDAEARARDSVRLLKVQEAKEIRSYEYSIRREKAALRIEEAQRIADEIVQEKRRVFEEKEEMAKLRLEIKRQEDEQKLIEKKEQQEKEMAHRRKIKADVDEQARLHMEHIKKKEEEINRRLKARGLLPEPEDRMKRTDEEEKKKILASLESTKETEAKMIRRKMKEESIEKNMSRKMQADEYKRKKVMDKMEEDDKKLEQVKEERAKIKLKKEIAANDALKEKHRVAEMAKKALGNKALTDLLDQGGSIDDAAEMVSTMLGFAPSTVKLKAATKQKKSGGDCTNGKKARRKVKKNNNMSSTGGSTTGGLPSSIPMSLSPTAAAQSMSTSISQTYGESRFTVPADPYYEVETIRKRQNKELLQILQEEQRQEETRERKLKALQEEGLTPQELQATQERFARERNEASNRMLRYTKQHEEVLALALKTAREQASLRKTTAASTGDQ
ncbi:hypothetical protein TrLO_g10814 [Triparma laevis f. longispina]|uniref:Uncharacterized protein n=1 Tax=Triparma laevis f. longispina TaxID=1714387 RepID=A0A9W7FTV3_9STRA|nr:hypothetical protein TrLO_g10814 [Triparma laevis f. longispina]